MATHYELMVIGAGPAGQKAALQAVKLGKSVAVVEREGVVGGACVSTGTLPSKTLRETVHTIAMLKKREMITGARTPMSKLLERKEHVVKHQVATIQGQLDRNGVDVLRGEASFQGPHTVRVLRDGMHKDYTADL